MKISIITISFNSEKTIEDTIKSVVSQNVDNLEYIIVDALSTDRTLEIINKYKDDRFKIISEKDKGISDAFNKGINISTGEIIGIINSDDMLMQNALSVVEKTFELNPDIDIVHGNVIRFVDSVANGYEVKPCTDLEHLKSKFLLNHPAIFVRKRAYEKYGLFSLEYKCAMDRELISKMYFNGAKFLYVDMAFTAFREGGVSDVKFAQTIKEYKKLSEKNGVKKSEIFKYVLKLYFRRYLLRLAKLLGIENVLRHYIKKQRIPKIEEKLRSE